MDLYGEKQYSKELLDKKVAEVASQIEPVVELLAKKQSELQEAKQDQANIATLKKNQKALEALPGELTDKILMIAETDKAAIGQAEGVGPISGRAMKLSMTRTLAKVARRRVDRPPHNRRVILGSF